MTPGLPWPWTAQHGGAVRAANGSLVVTCADRVAAAHLIRDIGPVLRELTRKSTPVETAPAPVPAVSAWAFDDTIALQVNGTTYTFVGAVTESADALATAINASALPGCVARSGPDGHVSICFEPVRSESVALMTPPATPSLVWFTGA